MFKKMPFNRMPDRMPEVKRASHSVFAGIGLNDVVFNLNGPMDEQRQISALEQLKILENFPVTHIVNKAVFEHFRKAGAHLFSRQRFQKSRVDANQSRIADRTHLIFQRAQIHTVLTANSRIHHAQQRSRYVNEIDAALECRRHKSAQVRNNAAAKVNQQTFPVRPVIVEQLPQRHAGIYGFGRFARFNFNEFYRAFGREFLQQYLRTMLLRIGIGQHKNAGILFRPEVFIERTPGVLFKTNGISRGGNGAHILKLKPQNYSFFLHGTAKIQGCNSMSAILLPDSISVYLCGRFQTQNMIFDNTKTAFALKSDTELDRAYFLFKLIASEPLVRIGTAVTNFAIKAHLPVEGLIRATVFDHFCGGVTEHDCLPVVDKMFSKGVCSVLDYSVEGKEAEAQFDAALQMTIKTISFARERQAIPFAVFKPTGFGRFALYEKKGRGEAFTAEETREWNRVLERFEQVGKIAYENDVALLIDAEESWMQDAADQIVTDLMRRYNKQKAIVYNTLQLYRHDRLNYLKKLHEQARAEGFHIGMKLVRGAYMEKENNRAAEMGYATPICASKQATDENFDATVAYMMQHLTQMAIFAGTHNEQSSYKLMELMKTHGVEKSDPRIWFGQLYGMSDNISFNLADAGYNVAKYLPFGPVRDVMPYLIRRAEENTSVAGQTSRELNLIKTERERRKKEGR